MPLAEQRVMWAQEFEHSEAQRVHQIQSYSLESLPVGTGEEGQWFFMIAYIGDRDNHGRMRLCLDLVMLHL